MQRSNKIIIRVLSTVCLTFFGFALTLMVHDTLGIHEKLSQEDIQAVAASHPPLYDSKGHSVRLSSEEEYEHALVEGIYQPRPDATFPIISPKGEIAMVDMHDAPMAFLKGWRVESYEHAVDRVLQFKQQDAMWLNDGAEMFFHMILVQFSAILLLGVYMLSKFNALRDDSSLVARTDWRTE